MTTPLTFGSTFAGIGGFDLAFERAGMQCLWQIEQNQQCQKVLSNHWPNVERVDDVKDLEAIKRLKPVDVISGGFPCQDLSVAGKRKGLAGERSGLWFDLQWGSWIGHDNLDSANLMAPQQADPDQYFTKHLFDDGALTYRVGKKAAGHMLDGREHREYPVAKNSLATSAAPRA